MNFRSFFFSIHLFTLDSPHSSSSSSPFISIDLPQKDGNGKYMMVEECFWEKDMLKRTRKLGRQTKYTGIAGMLAPLNAPVTPDSDDEDRLPINSTTSTPTTTTSPSASAPVDEATSTSTTSESPKRALQKTSSLEEEDGSRSSRRSSSSEQQQERVAKENSLVNAPVDSMEGHASLASYHPHQHHPPQQQHHYHPHHHHLQHHNSQPNLHSHQDFQSPPPSSNHAQFFPPQQQQHQPHQYGPPSTSTANGNGMNLQYDYEGSSAKTTEPNVARRHSIERSGQDQRPQDQFRSSGPGPQAQGPQEPPEARPGPDQARRPSGPYGPPPPYEPPLHTVRYEQLPQSAPPHQRGPVLQYPVKVLDPAQVYASRNSLSSKPSTSTVPPPSAPASYMTAPTRKTPPFQKRVPDAHEQLLLDYEVAKNVSQIMSKNGMRRYPNEPVLHRPRPPPLVTAATPAPPAPLIPLAPLTTYHCQYCSRPYSNPRTVQRHEQICQARKQQIPPIQQHSQTQQDSPHLLNLLLSHDPAPSTSAPAPVTSRTVSGPPAFQASYSRTFDSIYSPTHNTGDLMLTDGYEFKDDTMFHDPWVSRDDSFHSEPPSAQLDMEGFHDPHQPDPFHDPLSNEQIRDSLRDLRSYEEQGFEVSPVEREEEPITRPGSASNSSGESSSRDTASLEPSPFVCTACKKSVGSDRSLRRHYSTCKAYQADMPNTAEQFSPPKRKAPTKPRAPKKPKEDTVSQEKDAAIRAVLNNNPQNYSNPMVPSRPPQQFNQPFTAAYPSLSTDWLGSNKKSYSNPTVPPTGTGYSNPTPTVPPSSTVEPAGILMDLIVDEEDGDSRSSSGTVTSKPTGPNPAFACVDCNKQLCSMSNLKRHRATCKAATASNSNSPPARVSPPLPEPEVAAPPPPIHPYNPPHPQQIPLETNATVTYTKSVPTTGRTPSDPTPPMDSSTHGKSVGEVLRAQHIQRQLNHHNSRIPPPRPPNPILNLLQNPPQMVQQSQMSSISRQAPPSLQSPPLAPPTLKKGVIEHKNTELVVITSEPLVEKQAPSSVSERMICLVDPKQRRSPLPPIGVLRQGAMQGGQQDRSLTSRAPQERSIGHQGHQGSQEGSLIHQRPQPRSLASQGAPQERSLGHQRGSLTPQERSLASLGHQGSQEGSIRHHGSQDGSRASLDPYGHQERSLGHQGHQGSQGGSLTSPAHRIPQTGSRSSLDHQGSQLGSLNHQGSQRGSLNHHGSQDGSRASFGPQGPQGSSVTSLSNQGSQPGSLTSPAHRGPQPGSRASLDPQGASQTAPQERSLPPPTQPVAQAYQVQFNGRPLPPMQLPPLQSPRDHSSIGGGGFGGNPTQFGPQGAQNGFHSPSQFGAPSSARQGLGGQNSQGPQQRPRGAPGPKKVPRYQEMPSSFSESGQFPHHQVPTAAAAPQPTQLLMCPNFAEQPHGDSQMILQMVPRRDEQFQMPVAKPIRAPAKRNRPPTTKKGKKENAEVVEAEEDHKSSTPGSPLDSIITSTPLSIEVHHPHPSKLNDLGDDESSPSCSETPMSSSGNSKNKNMIPYLCPECDKKYSCRKNVKRHRMAVHKMTLDEILAKPEQPAPPEPAQLTPSGRRHTVAGMEDLTSPPKLSKSKRKASAAVLTEPVKKGKSTPKKEEEVGESEEEMVTDEEEDEVEKVAQASEDPMPLPQVHTVLPAARPETAYWPPPPVMFQPLPPLQLPHTAHPSWNLPVDCNQVSTSTDYQQPPPPVGTYGDQYTGESLVSTTTGEFSPEDQEKTKLLAEELKLYAEKKEGAKQGMEDADFDAKLLEELRQDFGVKEIAEGDPGHLALAQADLSHLAQAQLARGDHLTQVQAAPSHLAQAHLARQDSTRQEVALSHDVQAQITRWDHLARGDHLAQAQIPPHDHLARRNPNRQKIDPSHLAQAQTAPAHLAQAQLARQDSARQEADPAHLARQDHLAQAQIPPHDHLAPQDSTRQDHLAPTEPTHQGHLARQDSTHQGRLAHQNSDPQGHLARQGSRTILAPSYIADFALQDSTRQDQLARSEPNQHHLARQASGKGPSYFINYVPQDSTQQEVAHFARQTSTVHHLARQDSTGQHHLAATPSGLTRENLARQDQLARQGSARADLTQAYLVEQQELARQGSIGQNHLEHFAQPGSTHHFAPQHIEADSTGLEVSDDGTSEDEDEEPRSTQFHMTVEPLMPRAPDMVPDVLKHMEPDPKPAKKRGARGAPKRCSEHRCTGCGKKLGSDYSLRRHRAGCAEVQRGLNPNYPKPPAKRLSSQQKRQIKESAEELKRVEMLPPPAVVHECVDEFKAEREFSKRTSPMEFAYRNSSEEPDFSMLSPPSSPSTASSSGSIAAGANQYGARHVCEGCGRTYSTEWNLARHMRAYRKVDTYFEPKCKNDYLELRFHDDKAHPLIISRKFLSQTSPLFYNFMRQLRRTTVIAYMDLYGVTRNDFRLLLDIHIGEADIDAIKVTTMFELSMKYEMFDVEERLSEYFQQYG